MECSNGKQLGNAHVGCSLAHWLRGDCRQLRRVICSLVHVHSHLEPSKRKCQAQDYIYLSALRLKISCLFTVRSLLGGRAPKERNSTILALLFKGTWKVGGKISMSSCLSRGGFELACPASQPINHVWKLVKVNVSFALHHSSNGRIIPLGDGHSTVLGSWRIKQVELESQAPGSHMSALATK